MEGKRRANRVIATVLFLTACNIDKPGALAALSKPEKPACMIYTHALGTNQYESAIAVYGFLPEFNTSYCTDLASIMSSDKRFGGPNHDYLCICGKSVNVAEDVITR